MLDREVIHGHSLQLGDINRDGQGNFTRKVIAVGHDWHETRLADLDGDGDLDLLNKPYTWDAPRVDVWLNHVEGKSPTSPDRVPEDLLTLESLAW